MTNAPEHAVIVRFNYGSVDLEPLFALEDKLKDAIESTGTGEYDGNEIVTDGSRGTLYMYGPDADQLFEAIRPALESSIFMRGAVATKRYGPPADGIRESTVVIAP